MRTLAPRERRLIAIGLLVALMAAIWLLLIAPVIGGFQARSTERLSLLARYRSNQHLLASIPSLRQATLDQRHTASLYQITAPTQAAAVEALKQRLDGGLADAGGTVSGVQPVQADIPPGWISVRADAQINLTQLTQALQQLENEAPYVVVEYVSINADRALRAGRAQPLDVRLQVSALFHPAPVR